MNRIILFAFMLVYSFGLLNCGNDCPEVIQPEVQELSKWQKQRFPYSRLYKLTFRIEDAGSIDTIIFYKSRSDSGTINYGNGVNIDDNCPEADQDRYRTFSALYVSGTQDQYLKFKNSTENNPGITAIWLEDSLGISHDKLNEIFGKKNEKKSGDSTTHYGRTYDNSLCFSGNGWQRDSVSTCYSYPSGFVYLYDHLKSKKWYLLEAE